MDESQRLIERLPDYLNGHVTGTDAQHIAQLLEHDADWRAQAAAMANLRGAVDAEIAQMDSEHGLHQLHARIQAPVEAMAPMTMTAPPPQSRQRWWERLFALYARPWVMHGAIATLAVVCGAQAWMLGQGHDARPDVAWRDAPLAVAAPAANVQVRFVAGATLAQVEAALVRARARLVAGPDGQHTFLLQADDATAALVQLRASEGVRDASLVASAAP